MSCNTSYNVLRQFVGMGGGGGGVGAVDIRGWGGGVVQKSLQILDLRRLAGMSR